MTTSAELTCAYTANDADGIHSPYFCLTSSAGTTGDSAALTLDPADVAPTDTVTCEVTIEDTDGATATLSDSVTVDSTASHLCDHHTSTGVTTATTLTCAAVVSDDDGETPTLAYT